MARLCFMLRVANELTGHPDRADLLRQQAGGIRA